MAGARQGQTNNNRRAAESNWQFVIFIASTPLHPKRGIISRDESRGKSIGRDCEASVPLPSPSSLCSWVIRRFSLTLSSSSLALTPFHFFFFSLMTLFLAAALSLAASLSPSLTLWHLTWLTFHYVESTAIYQRMGSSHRARLTGGYVSLLYLSHPFLRRSCLNIVLATRVRTCDTCPANLHYQPW